VAGLSQRCCSGGGAVVQRRREDLNANYLCCKSNGIDPEVYLRNVFERIADHPINRIHELLPWNVRLPVAAGS
jgi:IS66 C-terminal element